MNQEVIEDVWKCGFMEALWLLNWLWYSEIDLNMPIADIQKGYEAEHLGTEFDPKRFAFMLGEIEKAAPWIGSVSLPEKLPENVIRLKPKE